MMAMTILNTKRTVHTLADGTTAHPVDCPGCGAYWWDDRPAPANGFRSCSACRGQEVPVRLREQCPFCKGT